MIQKHRIRSSKAEDDALSRTVFSIDELAELKRKFEQIDVDRDVSLYHSFPLMHRLTED